MKTLEIKTMEATQGGDGATCVGVAVGAAAFFTFATIATGGAAALAVLAIGSLGSGSFCDNPFR